MRLTLNALGLELDITLGIATAEAEDDDEYGRDLGYTSGTFIGFAPHITPEDCPLPQRTPAWDEPEER